MPLVLFLVDETKIDEAHEKLLLRFGWTYVNMHVIGTDEHI